MKTFFQGIISSLIVGLLLVSVYHFTLNHSTKIAVVDSNKLLSEYKETEKAIAEIEKKSAVYKNNLDTLTADFETRLRKFEKERPGMSEKELKLAQEVLRGKQNQLQQYREVVQTKMQEQDQQVSAKLYEKINAVVKEYGKKHNYDVIIGAKGDGGVLYGDDAVDITKELILILNNEAE